MAIQLLLVQYDDIVAYSYFILLIDHYSHIVAYGYLNFVIAHNDIVAFGYSTHDSSL